MNAALAALVCMVLYALGYRFWSGYLATRVFSLDPSRATPAHTLRDDVDYVPTRPQILFGHHYASITGLAPMLGPAIAVIWGWLPALLWVVFGAIFVGCVHDFSSLVVSMRARGMSIGAVAEGIVGARAKTCFHLVIFFGVALAMGVFIIAIAQLFRADHFPEAVLPSGGLMIVAVGMGYLLQVKRWPLAPVTAAGFVIMLALVGTGAETGKAMASGWWPTDLGWKASLLGYGFLASVLPVWSLLQPRDFVNSLLLYLGLGMMYAGIFVARPEFAAPALQASPPGAPPLFPFVFIVIACGAASGFHSLVSSGTTAKQIANEAHARPIGYGGMIGESLLGLVAVIACTAGALSRDAWTSPDGVYASWAAIKAPGTALGNFIHGGAGFIAELGVPLPLCVALVSVVVVSFALTTLDSATRLLRFNLQEIGETLDRFALGRALQGRIVASLAAVTAIGLFALSPAGIRLWALFGTVNQLLAGLALLVVTLYLLQRRRAWLVTGIPCVFMLASTLLAMLGNLRTNLAIGDWTLGGTGLVLLGLGLWILVEAALALRRTLAGPAVETLEIPLPLPATRPGPGRPSPGGRRGSPPPAS